MTNLSARRVLLARNAIHRLRAVAPLAGEKQAVRPSRLATTGIAFASTLFLTLAVAAYLFFGDTLISFLRDIEMDLWLRPAVMLLIALAVAGLVRLIKSLPRPSMPVSPPLIRWIGERYNGVLRP